MTSAFLLGAAEGPRVTALGSTYVTKTDGAQVDGAYSLMEKRSRPGSTAPSARPARERSSSCHGGCRTDSGDSPRTRCGC